MPGLIILLILLAPLIFVIRPRPNWRIVATRKRAGLMFLVTVGCAILVFLGSALLTGWVRSRDRSIAGTTARTGTIRRRHWCNG